MSQTESKSMLAKESTLFRIQTVTKWFNGGNDANQYRTPYHPTIGCREHHLRPAGFGVRLKLQKEVRDYVAPWRLGMGRCFGLPCWCGGAPQAAWLTCSVPFELIDHSFKL